MTEILARYYKKSPPPKRAVDLSGACKPLHHHTTSVSSLSHVPCCVGPCSAMPCSALQCGAVQCRVVSGRTSLGTLASSTPVAVRGLRSLHSKLPFTATCKMYPYRIKRELYSMAAFHLKVPKRVCSAAPVCCMPFKATVQYLLTAHFFFFFCRLFVNSRFFKALLCNYCTISCHWFF